LLGIMKNVAAISEPKPLLRIIRQVIAVKIPSRTTIMPIIRMIFPIVLSLAMPIQITIFPKISFLNFS